ncbi:MAG: hypothetical protein ABIR71_05990, partial [Chthoniobacterales bacterium]
MKFRSLLFGSTVFLSLLVSGFSGPRPPRAPFQVPLPIMPVLAPTSTDATTDYYDITMQVGQ